MIQKDPRSPAFTAVLLTAAKTREQPKCPQTGERVEKMWYTHAMEYYAAVKKATTPLAGTRLQLEIIPLSEVRGTKANIRGHHLHLESQTCHKRT